MIRLEQIYRGKVRDLGVSLAFIIDKTGTYAYKLVRLVPYSLDPSREI